MKSKIHFITLAVADLQAALKFYRDGLDLPTKGIVGTEFEDGAVVFFKLKDDLILSLYPRASLAKDAKIAPSPPASGAFSIGHLVGSKAEVDALMARANAAGATITDPAHDRFWGGYSGYFLDLDQHLWEIAFNPEQQTP